MPTFLTGDVVAAVFALADRQEFEAGPTQIQAAFMTVAHEFPDLMGDVNFGKVGALAGSGSIEGALDGLAMGRYFTRYNKSLDRHQLVSERLRPYFEERLRPRFEAAGVSVQRLEQASRTFFERLDEIAETDDVAQLGVPGR